MEVSSILTLSTNIMNEKFEKHTIIYCEYFMHKDDICCKPHIDYRAVHGHPLDYAGPETFVLYVKPIEEDIIVDCIEENFDE